MKKGDLVQFKRPEYNIGALTAVKYFQRLENQIGGKTGLVLSKHGDSALIKFENTTMVIHEKYLEVVNG